MRQKVIAVGKCRVEVAFKSAKGRQNSSEWSTFVSSFVNGSSGTAFQWGYEGSKKQSCISLNDGDAGESEHHGIVTLMARILPMTVPKWLLNKT